MSERTCTQCGLSTAYEPYQSPTWNRGLCMNCYRPATHILHYRRLDVPLCEAHVVKEFDLGVAMGFWKEDDDDRVVVRLEVEAGD